jgi:hypothetical protein
MVYFNCILCSLIPSIVMSFSIFNCKVLIPPTKMIRSYATTRICMKTTNHEYSQVTKILIRPTVWKIDHTTPIHLIGSCFTDTISNSLKSYKFNSYSNGQGIMFNPISISKCLDNIIQCEYPLPFFVAFLIGRWRNLYQYDMLHTISLTLIYLTTFRQSI